MATFNEEDYKKRSYSRVHPICDDDEIVITGMSGRFPNASNIAEFSHNLYNKIDMVDDAEVRWRHTNPEIPKRMGKIDRLEKFDSAFFGVHFRQAHSMDPQCRLLLEHAYESVLDAGINPKSLRGTRTGVFVGACFAESEKTWFYEKVPAGGVGLTGCARAMLANRISYTMGLTGPSFLMDTACSSSMYALDLAFNALRNGECDAALVGGVNLLLHPHVTLQFARLGVLSDDGYCRPFDQNANGYTRSEAVCVLFLQRARDAKRVYGTLVYSKANCDGFKEEGITYPSGKIQRQLLSEFYKEIQIDPRTVNYVEAHATGTVVGDPEECYAIDSVFCQGRENPLSIGSVKSNIGHSESTSGCCSVAKALLAFHKSLIPPNINFEKVRSTIPALTEGRLSVVTDPRPLEGPLVAINSFGFGGANAHALLRGNMTPKKNHGIPDDPLPRLLIWSGRTELACNTVIDDVCKRPLDGEYVALLNNIQSDPIPANLFRSYGVYVNDNGKNALCVAREVQHHTGLKRPVVFVFSGMGSQWIGMGTSLLQIPIFRDAIYECHETLKPRGLDLLNIITSNDPHTFDNILHSFVGIAAIQIGLTDILRELNIVPDYIIGHSVGELGCAYADECLTRQEMILCAYSRGMASLETEVVFGSMAAVGLGYKKIRTILPIGVEVACHNSADSCTISGPAENISKFVKELKSKGVFAKEVPTSNIAYHSKYISEMGPKLLTRLEEVIKSPKKRSEKWLSSSVPKSRWDKLESQYCSAEYQTNNLLSPVLFEETAVLLPENSLTIEIAPHGLLQAILKKSMTSAVHVNLTQRDNKENINVLFTGLGKLYMNGIDIPIEKMYPPIQYPVSACTPLISPLIKWDHSEDWFLAKFDTVKDSRSGERTCKIALTDHDYEYVTGHVIDGRVLFPATGYLFLVWETLGFMHGMFYVDLQLEFQDVKFLRATAMQKDTEVTFIVMIHRGTGQFEITEGNSPVVTGTVKVLDPAKFTELPETPKINPNDTVFNTRDFYKELRLRGYHYDGEFKSVVESRTDGLGGKVKWNLNFASFMDCMLQLLIVAKDTRDLIIPTGIDRIVINPLQHFNMAKALGDAENTIFDVKICNELKIIQSGGIEIHGLHANAIARRKPPGIPILESYEFISHLPSKKLSIEEATRVLVQLGFENAYALKIKSVEVDDDNRQPIIQLFNDALGDLPLVSSEAMYLTNNECELTGVHVENGKLSSLSNCSFIIASKCTNNLTFVETAVGCMKERGYLISREDLSTDFTKLGVLPSCRLVCAIPTDTELLVMFQYVKRKNFGTTSVVKVSSQDIEYSWIEELKTAVANGNGPVILVAEKESYSGILGLVNCLRREPFGQAVTCVFVADPNAPAFDSEHPLYKAQLKLGLVMNVYQNGKWGTYRHLKIKPETELKPETREWFVNALTRGDLSSFKCLQRNPFDVNEVENMPLKIVYSSLNFRDVMLASGKLSDNYLNKKRDFNECTLGLEFSGVTENGTRIMGMIKSGAMASNLRADPVLTWEVPAHWTLEEATTIPVVYSTVYHALFQTVSIKKGKKILIHSGTGGIGLAAIRVTLAYGLEVFTTVSSQEKRKFLLNMFPELQDSHIGYSRDTSFYDMVMLQTNGKGVDYVLNSLAEEKLRTSVKCLGKEGQFLEIGKFDMANDNKIGLGHFLNEISFHAVLLDNLFEGTVERKKALAVNIDRDMRNGIIVPLKTTVFPINEVEQAFRFLASGKHIGKVLLKVRESEFDKQTLPINFQPRIYFNPNMTYVIPGGLGGFGLELADWMIIRGCRKLVLSSSRGVSRPYQSYRINLWKSYDAKVIVNTSDITTPSGCLELIQEATKLGPVGGIFNLAVRLRDAIFENQDPVKFAESIAVKATATKYLDEISRRLCPKLEYFVVFSSVSCGRGNAGQTNYGMANSIMERIIEARCEKGLPGTAIQWGAIGEVGLVADMHENSKIDMEIGGTLQQRISSCLQELDMLLSCNKPVVSCMVVAEKKYKGSGKGGVLEAVMNIMSIRDIKSVSFDTKLSELGMDSLMAVEIKQTLEREFEIFLSALDVRTLTFSKLQQLAEEKNKDKEEMHLKYAKNDSAQGVGLLMRNFGDETHCDQTLLRVNSQNNSENIVSGLVLIPGIEGVAGDIYRQVANDITLPSFILQSTNKGHMKSSKEIAESVFNEIYQNVFKNTEFYYLVGYSFGAAVTLELAKMLEEHGMKGHVILVDGAPQFLKQLALDQIKLVSDNSEDEDKKFQDMILMASLRVIFPGEELDYWNTIETVGTDWNKRLDKLVEVGENHNIYSGDYTRKMLNALINRIKMAADFSTDDAFQIESDITLVRPTEVSVMDIDEDYGLSSYTKGHVNLKFVDGNHTTMLENPKLVQIINEVDPFLQSERTFVSYMKG